MMPRDFRRLTDRFDAVICGGGIYGAWCAYDAALRGLKVLLVDQGDWAGATSSASSKLIHGGLRYLEMLDFSLVKKSLRERQMLLQVAPHRIWPLRFCIPVYRDSRLGRLRLKAGLFIYDLLAGLVHSEQAHRYYAKAAFSQRFPCLDSTYMSGGFSYPDAQTDDARLVLELIDGAQTSGAVCLNYCKLAEISERQGHISAVKLLDMVTGEEAQVATRHVINTAGPWLAATEQCRVTKGVHLVLPKLLDDEALLLTAKADGRVFFIMPWYGLTLLGTTDTDFNGDINRVCVEAEDVDYLLSEASRVLKSVQWTEKDIIGRFAGLRVLQQSSHNTPSTVSRDWALKCSDNGLLTSIGGKITSARADAARIIDKLCEQSGIKAACQTGARPFPWAPVNYRQWAIVKTKEVRQLGVDNESAKWLLRRYGRHVESIFKSISENPQLSERILPTVPFIQAELGFCVHNEMVVHLDDLLRRRIPLMILAKLSVDDLRYLAAGAATALSWDSATLNNEINRCLKI